MGRAKDAEIEKEEKWEELCKRKGWVCQLCGEFPTDIGCPFGYERGLCPSCRNPKD